MVTRKIREKWEGSGECVSFIAVQAIDHVVPSRSPSVEEGRRM
jgi:hypothetical protein